MEINGEDPFNETLLIAAICALRKRRKRSPPKVFVKLHPEFLIGPPEGFVPMPPDDPRTKVPSQITEAFGSGDAELFKNTIMSVCHPDMKHYMQYDGNQNPYGPNTRYMEGATAFVDYCMAVFRSIPDFVASLYEQEFYYNVETNESYGCYRSVGFMTKVGRVSLDKPHSDSSGSSSSSSNGADGVQPHAPEYSVTPMQNIKTFQVAKYNYLMNAEGKIVKYCHLFKQMTHDPEVVSRGLASRMDKKMLKSKFGTRKATKRQKII